MPDRGQGLTKPLNKLKNLHKFWNGLTFTVAIVPVNIYKNRLK